LISAYLLILLLTIMTDPAAADVDVEDDDPVVAEYDVYITPEAEEQQLYVLQYLNRPPDQPFTKGTQSQPAELRVKKESGFVEVDVPIDILHNYNRPAGVRWGESLRKTKGFGQRAFGIASGFERTMPRATNRAGAGAGAGEGAPAASTAIEDDDNFEEYVTHFEDANEKGHVLNVQTFGGQIQNDEGKGPSYMLGTFRDGRLQPCRWKHHADQTRSTAPHSTERSRTAPHAVPPPRRIRPARGRQPAPREGVGRRRKASRAQGILAHCQEVWG
jgi:hypothetical protein